MNFHAHVYVTPAVRIDASVDGHPEYDRTVQMPRDAPDEWFTYAYLLSVGIESAEEDLTGRGWSVPYPGVGAERRRLQLPGFPHTLEVRTRFSHVPQVGDARVAIVDDEGSGGTLPAVASSGWQTDAPPFRCDDVNHELERRYGLVMPRLDESGLGDFRRGIRPSSPISQMLDALTPVRRLALLAHLDQAGILDEAPLDPDQIERATEGLRRLLFRVADGVEQDPATGWLPAVFVDTVLADLGWTTGASDACRIVEPLVSFARRARLMRRFKGEVVVTNAGRRLLSDPVQAFSQIARLIAWPEQGSWYQSAWGYSSFEVTAALLALADGAAATFDDIGAVVASSCAARASVRDAESNESWNDELVYDRARTFGSRAADGGAEEVDRLIASFQILSEDGALGRITPVMRAVAGAALL